MSIPESTHKNQTIISVIGPSGCGKSLYINPIAEQLQRNGHTVEVISLFKPIIPPQMYAKDSNARFVILHIIPKEGGNMRIEFNDNTGPMDLFDALHEQSSFEEKH